MADMPGVDLDWQGLDVLQGIVRETPKNVTEFSRNEIFDFVTEVFNESQKQVPRRTGALAGSGTVQITNDDPFEVTIGYGGSSAGYALAVHENLTAQHKSPTKSKYLEDPANEAMANAEDGLAGEVEGAILGQFPSAPSVEARGDAAGGVSVAAKMRRHRRATNVRIKKMTDTEITAALRAIDRGHELKMQGERSIRVFRRRNKNS